MDSGTILTQPVLAQALRFAARFNWCESKESNPLWSCVEEVTQINHYGLPREQAIQVFFRANRYTRLAKWSERQDLHLRPSGPKPEALLG